MKVTLTPKHEKFINKKVKDGLYENASDVVLDAIRQFEQRDHIIDDLKKRLNDLSLIFASYENMGLGEGDIGSLAFIVLMQATKDMDKDLKMIMDEVKSMTAAKSKLRELISKVKKDVSANASQKDEQSPLDFSNGMGSEEAYHQAQIPIADTESKEGVQFIITDLFIGHLDDVDQLRAIEDDLKGKLDGMSEMSEMTSMRLQMMMDRRSKFISTLSNIMKKISTTQDTIVQNLK